MSLEPEPQPASAEPKKRLEGLVYKPDPITGKDGGWRVEGDIPEDAPDDYLVHLTKVPFGEEGVLLEVDVPLKKLLEVNNAPDAPADAASEPDPLPEPEPAPDPIAAPKPKRKPKTPRRTEPEVIEAVADPVNEPAIPADEPAADAAATPVTIDADAPSNGLNEHELFEHEHRTPQQIADDEIGLPEHLKSNTDKTDELSSEQAQSNPEQQTDRENQLRATLDLLLEREQEISNRRFGNIKITRFINKWCNSVGERQQSENLEELGEYEKNPAWRRWVKIALRGGLGVGITAASVMSGGIPAIAAPLLWAYGVSKTINAGVEAVQEVGWGRGQRRTEIYSQAVLSGAIAEAKQARQDGKVDDEEFAEQLQFILQSAVESECVMRQNAKSERRQGLARTLISAIGTVGAAALGGPIPLGYTGGGSETQVGKTTLDATHRVFAKVGRHGVETYFTYNNPSEMARVAGEVARVNAAVPGALPWTTVGAHPNLAVEGSKHIGGFLYGQTGHVLNATGEAVKNAYLLAANYVGLTAISSIANRTRTTSAEQLDQLTADQRADLDQKLAKSAVVFNEPSIAPIGTAVPQPTGDSEATIPGIATEPADTTAAESSPETDSTVAPATMPADATPGEAPTPDQEGADWAETNPREVQLELYDDLYRRAHTSLGSDTDKPRLLLGLPAEAVMATDNWPIILKQQCLRFTDKDEQALRAALERKGRKVVGRMEWQSLRLAAAQILPPEGLFSRLTRRPRIIKDDQYLAIINRQSEIKQALGVAVAPTLHSEEELPPD